MKISKEYTIYERRLLSIFSIFLSLNFLRTLNINVRVKNPTKISVRIQKYNTKIGSL